MTMLARGMTVQSDRSGCYAFCVRCKWESTRKTYKAARAVANKPCPQCSTESKGEPE